MSLMFKIGTAAELMQPGSNKSVALRIILYRKLIFSATLGVIGLI
jgi:hypothetical protein